MKALKIIAVVIVVIGVVVGGGWIYLMNSPWSVMFTLFADDHRAENYRSMDEIFPYKEITAPAETLPLYTTPASLPDEYVFEGERLAVADFLARTETTSLLVLRNNEILYEEYFRGYTEEDRITSWSVAKSFVSALIGIAKAERHIDSIDDLAQKYVPELAGTDYGAVTIRNLLTMSSGIDFDEDYDSYTSDINLIFPMAMGFQKPMREYVAELSSIQEQGTYNDYISSDTYVLGMIIEEATNQSLEQYLQEKIWTPLGMEFDAYWSTDRHDRPIGFCCLNVAARDYARFGLLYLNGGAIDNRQIVPREWVERSIRAEAPHLEPGDNPASFWTFGYGYQWWIPEESLGDFTAIGVWGQYIYVDPLAEMVIIKTSTDYHFDDNDHETVAFFRNVVSSFVDSGAGDAVSSRPDDFN